MACETCLEYGWIGGAISMASIHGLLLAILFLLSKRLRSKANKYLALALGGLFVILGYEALEYVGSDNQVPLFIQYTPLYLRTTIPVGIFYFTLFLINPLHELTKWEKTGLGAILLEMVVELLYLPNDFLMAGDATANHDYIASIGQIIGILASFIFIPWAIQKVNGYQKYLFQHYSSAGGKSLGWLSRFLWTSLALVTIWLVSFIQCSLGLYTQCAFTFGLFTIGLVALLFWIGYFVMLHSSWFDIVPVKMPENTDVSVAKLSSKTEVYHQQLLDLMGNDLLYQNPDLTLDFLAGRLQISAGYLSQIINEKQQKNFFEFVNEYRVEAVKKRLTDPEFANYTIMGVAHECGFQSKSTFNSAFKKFTGHTPSAYKKQSELKKKRA